MPGCILRVSGESFDVDAFLAGSSLEPYKVEHKGSMLRGQRVAKESGFKLDVSKANGDLEAEISDALTFLSKNESELQRLRHYPGVSDVRLDFACWQTDAVAQFRYFPPGLVAKAGALGIGIELSLHARSD